MVQPAVRIGTPHAAFVAARALQTPSDVARFEAMAPEFAALRAFLETPDWDRIRTRIMGDGRPPLQPRELGDVARLLRWKADGLFSEIPLHPDVRAAYLDAASEIEAFDRLQRRLAPVSPAPAPAPLPV